MKFLSNSKKRKTVVKIIAIVLAALFILATFASVLPAIVGAEDYSYSDGPLIRVGIYYGASAVSSIAFTSASGFEIGVTDSTHTLFTALVSTDLTALVAQISEGASEISVLTPEWEQIYAHSDASNPLCIRAKGVNAPITAAGNTYNGYIELAYSGGKIRMVSVAYLEDYVRGVVAAEVYSSWPAEALKSQAVVARTYTLHTAGKHSADGFDICSTQHCQAYKGVGAATESINSAVESTKGLIVTYGGKPALTTYHSSSGDTTESATSAWGGAPEQYPYLSVVNVGFNECENYTNGKWSYTVGASELYDYINSKEDYAGILKGPVESIKCERLGDSEYVNTLTVSDAYGNEIVVKKSATVRNFLTQYCKSACFTISTQCPVYAGENENYILDSQNMYVISADGGKSLSAPSSAATGIEALTSSGLKSVVPTGERIFTISGEGYGHGVGLSQYGSMTLAERGHDFRYILGLYYPGTEIADCKTITG